MLLITSSPRACALTMGMRMTMTTVATERPEGDSRIG